ncbi:Rieske 2Fe-2S domain-containing protein [Marivita sp.]|jgi:phenylpropionate dioxygenase-like ring-hydroxylating dioxygenase large terminal subunit|uniref:Rieske 2Fe-2S domain-containing protein n=1 Tax=Marivita sp. TaxID=2003365 RepID=UPI003F6D8CFC
MDWVAVALKDDVPPGVVIPSRIEDMDLAIWCTPSGRYHAWSDRCPHRGMRLSHGFVRGDTLACIYHGWQYNEEGACDYIPAHPKLTPPNTICVPTYTCTEAGGVIWVSLNKTDSALPALGGRKPVRSLPINLSATDLAAHFGAEDYTTIAVVSDHDVLIAVQPCTDNACMAHVLASPDTDRTTVSRWLEDLRATLEGMPA